MERSKRRIICITLLAVVAGVACDDDADGELRFSRSGFERSRGLADLDSQQRLGLCEWMVAARGGAGARTNCADDATFTVPSVERCANDLSLFGTSCRATVADMEVCVALLRQKPCGATVGGMFGVGPCSTLHRCLLAARSSIRRGY